MDVKAKAVLVLLRGIIWGMAGGLFGVVYLGVGAHLAAMSPGAPWPLPVASAIAGAFVGAFYSAKRAALVGAASGSVAAIVYLTAAADPHPGALPVLWVAGLAGLLSGGVASSIYERREAALLVAVAGLLAGAVAGLFALGLGPLGIPLGRPFSQALVMAPVTGTLFVVVTLARQDTLRVWVPQWLSVGIVASGIAALVGLSLWAFSATLASGVEPGVVDLIQATVARVPEAFAGGMMGGAAAGMVLEALSLHWLGSTARAAAAAGSPDTPAPRAWRAARGTGSGTRPAGGAAPLEGEARPR